ncbi:hypothetical protein QBC41DRAFT_327351 [Cercophora samala]|uniref:Uncharacterized protein n=1 Tax=Cercophora samala TaxID=330535 RepID=A0AA40D7G3_9PEZI|nr:hypothetical protein QBC41DRAFT_327351 [Cercophora samala]
MGRGRRWRRDTYPWDWFECDWCMAHLNWVGRPCYRRRFTCAASRRQYKKCCELVRAENAAKRTKTLPKAYRRAIMAAAAAAAAAAATPTENQDSNGTLNTSLEGNTEVAVVDEVNKLEESTPPEADTTTTETETETGREKGEVSALPATSKARSKPKHYEVDVKKPRQQRQAKSTTGPKSMIDEGVSLAFDDDDVASIHAANRKAWPRGQMPIAADATAEDWEIAELVRRGLIGPENLQTNYEGFEDEACMYTVRFVDTMKKGRKRKGCHRQGVRVEDLVALDSQSEWSYLDDEVYAQFLNDRETGSLGDWSELSFVCVPAWSEEHGAVRDKE